MRQCQRVAQGCTHVDAVTEAHFKMKPDQYDYYPDVTITKTTAQPIQDSQAAMIRFQMVKNKMTAFERACSLRTTRTVLRITGVLRKGLFVQK